VQPLTPTFSHGLTGDHVDAAADYGGTLDVEGQLTDLRLMTSFLENELNALRQENADFRRDVMTSALRSHASLTTDDVDRLIDKMAEVVNDTTTRQSAMKHGAAGFPRGTDTQRYRKKLIELFLLSIAKQER